MLASAVGTWKSSKTLHLEKQATGFCWIYQQALGLQGWVTSSSGRVCPQVTRENRSLLATEDCCPLLCKGKNSVPEPSGRARLLSRTPALALARVTRCVIFESGWETFTTANVSVFKEPANAMETIPEINEMKLERELKKNFLKPF